MSKVIIFPTDTVYGIGTSIKDIEGINKIYDIKHRDKSKPLPILCANLKQIEEIAYVDDVAKKLIDKFLPGPLTLILKSKQILIDTLDYQTVGVRIPNCKMAIDILENFGPMATTSVNDSGEPPINDYSEIKTKYGNLVDEIYHLDNFQSSNISSTIISLIDNEFKILRVGEISLDSIKAVLK